MNRPQAQRSTATSAVLRGFAVAGAGLGLTAAVWFGGCVVIWHLAQWWMSTLPPRECGTPEMCATFSVLLMWTVVSGSAGLVATLAAVVSGLSSKA